MYVSRSTAPPRTRIAGIGTYLPATERTSAESEDRIRSSGIDIPHGFIERSTGVRSRRIVGPGENASDLAVAAARQALDAAAVPAEEIDLLIFCSASHDVTEPATANIVQAKLGARNAATFDLKNACNSLLSAVDVADAYVRLGRARVVLVATGEAPSLVTSLEFASREDLVTNFAHVTMGDAGGALVLCATESASQGILATAWINRGEAWELGTVLGGGTMHPREREHLVLRPRSAELEAHARRDIPPVVARVLEAAEWRPGMVDVFACHQHSQRITVELMRVMGIDPQRAPRPLRYAGNAASANIALALAQAHEEGQLAPGRRVLLCGGSAGFSAIATAVSW